MKNVKRMNMLKDIQLQNEKFLLYVYGEFFIYENFPTNLKIYKIFMYI